MNSEKFNQMVREFPFIFRILEGQRLLSPVALANIEVKRADRNLLEVTPAAWAHDADAFGSQEGYRLVWSVEQWNTVRLEEAWSRSIPYGRNDQRQAEPIGRQLVQLCAKPVYIVEIYSDGWDSEERIPTVTIYKMEGFDWRSYVPPFRCPPRAVPS